MNGPTRELRNAKGEMCELQWEIIRPTRRFGRWKALLSYRVLDTDDWPGTFWLEYGLQFLGAGMGYTVAAWSRESLVRKFAKAERDCLGFNRPPSELVAGGVSESGEG